MNNQSNSPIRKRESKLGDRLTIERIKDSSLSAVFQLRAEPGELRRSSEPQFPLLPHPREIPIIRDETQIESMDGGKKHTERRKGRRGGEGGEWGGRRHGKARCAGRGRKKATWREKKIGIFLERRMIKLRMVRCYRNPDWDELRPSGTCTSHRYITIYTYVLYMNLLRFPRAASTDLILKCQCTRLAFNYKEKPLYFIGNGKPVQFHIRFILKSCPTLHRLEYHSNSKNVKLIYSSQILWEVN